MAPHPLRTAAAAVVGYANKGERPTRRGREVVSGRAWGSPLSVRAQVSWPPGSSDPLVNSLGHPTRLCLRSSLRGPGAEEGELGEWDSHSIDSNGMNIRTEEQTLPFPYSHSYPIPLPFQRDSASKRASVNPSPAAAMEAKCKCIPDPFSTSYAYSPTLPPLPQRQHPSQPPSSLSHLCALHPTAFIYRHIFRSRFPAWRP